MSLYLRLKFAGARTPRYPFDPPARSTADLDVFLSSRLIADRRKVSSRAEQEGDAAQTNERKLAASACSTPPLIPAPRPDGPRDNCTA